MDLFDMRPSVMQIKEFQDFWNTLWPKILKILADFTEIWDNFLVW